MEEKFIVTASASSSETITKLTRSSTKFLNMLKRFGAAKEFGEESALASDDERGDGEEHE